MRFRKYPDSCGRSLSLALSLCGVFPGLLSQCISVKSFSDHVTRNTSAARKNEAWRLGKPKLSPLGIGLFCCKSFFYYYLKWRRFLLNWAVKSYSASPMWQRVIFFFWQKNSAKFILCIYQCSELANRLNCSPSKRIGRLLVLILKCMGAYMELWNNNKNGIIHLESNQTNQQTH